MIINYDRYCSFIVLTTVIKIINYDCKTFIAHATGKCCYDAKRPHLKLKTWPQKTFRFSPFSFCAPGFSINSSLLLKSNTRG